MKAGDWEEAILQLKELVAIDSSHELANGMLASVYAQIGLTDKAADLFRQALRINPNNVLATYQMGLVLLTAGRHQEALDAFRPMLRDENDFLAHFHSALALIGLQRSAEARTLLLHSQKNMPSAHPLHEHLQKLLSATD